MLFWKKDLKSLLMLTSGNLLGFLKLSSRLFFLPSLVLFPSSMCNYRCSMCVHGMGRGTDPMEIMPLDLLEAILNQCSRLWIKPRIHFSGYGEPLMYPHILSAMQLCAAKGLTFGMTTNGHLLERHAKSLVQYGCHALNISVHGDAERQAQVTGVRDALEVQLRGIAAVEEAKRSQGTTYPHMALNCVISKDNLSQLREFLHKREGLPISSVTFQHLIFTRKEAQEQKDFLFASLAETEALEEFIAYAQSRRNRVQVNFFPRLNSGAVRPYYLDPLHSFGTSCLLPWITAIVYPGGTVGLCGKCFGNAKDSPLMDIINGTAMRSFRQAVARGRFQSEECFRCCHRHYD